MNHLPPTSLGFSTDADLPRIEPLDGGAEQARRWQALADASVGRAVFQTPGFVASARLHDEKRGRRLVLVCTDRFALPLSIGREQGFKVARILCEPLAQYSDCVGASPSREALAAAFSALRREAGVDLVVLRRVRDDAALAPALDALGADRADETLAADILLCETGPRPSAAGSISSEYKDAARRKRKLSTKSTVTFRILEGGPEARSLIRLSLDWKAEWVRERQIVSRLSSPEFRDDFADLFAGDGNGAVVGIVEENGEPVAVTAGFVHGGIFYDFLGAYRLDRTAEGVAKIAIAEMIDWSGKAGLSAFDFLPPGDPYKMTWTKTVTTVADRTMALSALGRLRAGLVDAKLVPAAKRIVKTLPPGLRGLVARVVR